MTGELVFSKEAKMIDGNQMDTAESFTK